ncbi:MAG TPA: STAS/SEC14 domain-containing protein [Thermoanaerobaculia bacterium]|jgi:hypothetical protein|nr:STAS/SEC14 domain-containing protein [Thermoanaerobaculia bacterium]
MVTRKIELTEEQDRTLEQLASSQGRSVSELVRTGIDVLLRSDIPFVPRLTERESELLLEINRGLPPASAERYSELMSRRRAGDLGPEEHRELLRLTDEAEQLQAERIERLAQLARLRGKPLRTVMAELGIRPSSDA